MWTDCTTANLTAARDAAIPAVLAALTSADVPLASGEVLVREVPADEDSRTATATTARPRRCT